MVNAIRKARFLAGMTQKELADRIGVRQVTVCQWESGKIKPSLNKIKPLAQILDTTAEELLKDRLGG